LINNIHPLLWEIERKRDLQTQMRFKVTPAKVEKTLSFLGKFLSALTGFNRIMTHDEKLVCYDLRTRVLQTAVTNFTSILANIKGSVARLKAITMLMVINCLTSGESETVLVSSNCYRSSFLTLLCRGKSKFIRNIASLVKLTATPTNALKEVVYKVDAKMENADDQEMSFCSISESLQEADLNDEKEE
jgi:hypothetical protein